MVVSVVPRFAELVAGLSRLPCPVFVWPVFVWPVFPGPVVRGSGTVDGFDPEFMGAVVVLGDVVAPVDEDPVEEAPPPEPPAEPPPLEPPPPPDD